MKKWQSYLISRKDNCLPFSYAFLEVYLLRHNINFEILYMHLYNSNGFLQALWEVTFQQDTSP